MGFENDRYRDEDGEPLMDFDDMPSDREAAVVDAGDDQRRERSPTPVHGYDPPDNEVVTTQERSPGSDEGPSSSLKRKKGLKDSGSGKKEKRQKSDPKLKAGSSSKSKVDDPEMKEMWDSLAAWGKKKRKKTEKTAAEIALLVEHFMAELELAAEEDAELNRQSKPAINKLKKLPLLTEVLSKIQLRREFLDHGVLTLLKNWLEILPDGSLPNVNIRSAVLKILTDFPLDLDQYDRREQLKKSGLGRVIMFLSRSDEEIAANKRLAKQLVDKWSRPIFNRSARFEDMRDGIDDERAPAYRRAPAAKKPAAAKAAMLGARDCDNDGDLVDFSPDRKSSQPSANNKTHASRPEALPLDFLVRPQSKIDPDAIRARAKQAVHDQRRVKINKKLQQLKAPKMKQQLQASRISVEGRGMVKFL